MQDATLPWLVLQLTGSPTQVGLLVFCRYLPFLTLGLFSGVMADRFDNRRLLIWTQAGQLVATAALAALAFSTDQAWPFFLLGAIAGAGTVLDAPSRQALTYQLVGRDDLPNAVALNSGVFNAGRVLGPAIGGVLIAVVGAGWCFTLNAASFLVFLICLVLIRVRELFPIDRGASQIGTLAAIKEGLDYAWHSQQTRLVLLIVALISLAGFNFRVLLPILAERTLQSGSTVFGLLCAAFGAGSVAGALVIATRGRASWRGIVTGALGFNAALLLLAPVHNVAVATVLLFFVGLSFSCWAANTQSVLQLLAPDRLRGRVVSLYVFALAGLAPAGALVAGWLCDVGGTELAFVVAGVTGFVTIGVAALWARRLPITRGGVLRPAEKTI